MTQVDVVLILLCLAGLVVHILIMMFAIGGSALILKTLYRIFGGDKG